MKTLNKKIYISKFSYLLQVKEKKKQNEKYSTSLKPKMKTKAFLSICLQLIMAHWFNKQSPFFSVPQ